MKAKACKLPRIHTPVARYVYSVTQHFKKYFKLI